MREQLKCGCLEVACVNLTLAAERLPYQAGASRSRSHRNE